MGVAKRNLLLSSSLRFRFSADEVALITWGSFLSVSPLGRLLALWQFSSKMAGIFLRNEKATIEVVLSKKNTLDS